MPGLGMELSQGRTLSHPHVIARRAPHATYSLAKRLDSRYTLPGTPAVTQNKETMANWKTSVASWGALASSLLTLACCVPLGFLGAAGAAGASLLARSARLWLLALSGILLAIGFYQAYRGARCGVRQARLNVALLLLATTVVLVVILFPQLVAGLLADWTSRSNP